MNVVPADPLRIKTDVGTEIPRVSLVCRFGLNDGGEEEIYELTERMCAEIDVKLLAHSMSSIDRLLPRVSRATEVGTW